MGNARRRSALGAPPARPNWGPQACAALLVTAVLFAFSPAFHAEFIRWDDPQYVTENTLLRDGAGLRKIWTPLAGDLPQYYPLVFSSYWLEYRLWQVAPAGYHVTNVVLHALNAVLVMRLVCALGASLWVAAGAAAVFALHPVQVESVAWVTERKNTLSGLFYLLAFLFYLQHRRSGRSGAYATSLLSFTCALLSKTQTVSLPVIVFFTDCLLQRSGRIPRIGIAPVAVRVAPMLLLALGGTWVTTAVERQRTLSWVELPTLTQRVLIAANVPWYYAATFLAPFSLAPIAPKWVVSAAEPGWWLGVLTWVVIVPLCLRWGTRIAAVPVWGTAQFFIALLPVLGLVPFAYQHYSYVATRFLYLSCIGGGVALAALAEWAAGGEGRTARRTMVVGVAIGLLAGCGLLTYYETQHWKTNLSFWTRAVARNPHSYPPNINLGLHYESMKHWPAALPYYQRAYELRPMDTYALTHYLRTLGVVRGPHAVVEAADAELARSSVNAYVAHLYRAMSFEQLGRHADAMHDYDRVLALTRKGSGTWNTAQRARERLAHATGR